MITVRTVSRYKGNRTVHIAGDNGSALCGRVLVAQTEQTEDEADCSWCLTRQRFGPRPEHEHRFVKICAECGEPWPCAGFIAESSGLCTATTASGRPCTRRAVYYGLCKMHDRWQ